MLGLTDVSCMLCLIACENENTVVGIAYHNDLVEIGLTQYLFRHNELVEIRLTHLNYVC